MPSPGRRGKAVEMTGRGKRGKTKDGFPLFPPPLEIAARFPHSHRLDNEVSYPDHAPPAANLRKEPLLGPGYPGAPLQAHLSIGMCSIDRSTW